MTVAHARPKALPEPTGTPRASARAGTRDASQGVLELVPEPIHDRAVADLAQAIVDVLAGQRPVDQVIPLVTTEVLAQLRRTAGRRPAAARRQAGAGGAASASTSGGRTEATVADRRGAVAAGSSTQVGRERRIVASTHVQRPVAGVVEAAVVVRSARRAAALALRLEWRESRWRCTVIDVRS